jgi:hypothetical protein
MGKKTDIPGYTTEQLQKKYAAEVKSGATNLPYPAWLAVLKADQENAPGSKKPKGKDKKSKKATPATPKDSPPAIPADTAPPSFQPGRHVGISEIREAHPDWTGEQCWAEYDRLNPVQKPSQKPKEHPIWSTVTSIDAIRKANPTWTEKQCRAEWDRLGYEALEKVLGRPGRKRKKASAIKPLPKPKTTAIAKIAIPLDLKPLDDKEEVFCREYTVNGMIGTQAAIVAGYGKKSAGVTASRLLKQANIQRRLKELQAESFKRIAARDSRYDLTADKVLQELSYVAMARLGDFLEVDPVTGQRYLTIQNASDEQLAGLKGLEITQLPPVTIGMSEYGEELEREVIKTKITLDKTKALEMLMKHFNLLGGEGNTFNLAQIDKVIMVLESSLARKLVQDGQKVP